MRTNRGLLLIAVTAALLAVGLAWSPVRAEGAPLRSGTIVGSAGLDWGSDHPWEQPGDDRAGCEYAPDCLAWLHTGCDPALAGDDPALTASIVDVGDLADGRTRRGLRLVLPRVPPLWPGAVIQFWRLGCAEIPEARLHSIADPCGWDGVSRQCHFRIPTDARWMTVSGYATTVGLSWTLG